MSKKRYKIDGPFVPLLHDLIQSDAYKLLSSTAKIAFTYFLRDKRSHQQEKVTLTFGQAKKYRVCQSPSTFGAAKMQLVENGLLDPVDGGGLNAPAIFRLSERWRFFGTDRFKKVPYKLGIGSKYFKTAMKDVDKKKKVVNARHPTSTASRALKLLQSGRSISYTENER
jgi:hypothetical protein